MHEEAALEAWFLHEKLVLSLLAERDAADLVRRMPAAGTPLAQTVRVGLFERAVTTYLEHHDVGSLAVDHLRGQLRPGRLVWLDQAIAFKGARTAVESMKRGGDGRASWTARLATDSTTSVAATYSAAWLTGGSATDQLSGTKRQFVLGYVETISENEIHLRPIVIGRRWLRSATRSRFRFPDDAAYVWPGAVDQFSGVDFSQRLIKTDLEVLKEIPEQVVKTWFADILGEPDVPKDWGGEQFDLWTTSRLSVDGIPLRAAFAFKGPAKFRPMTIATLGKNGDQIDRLARTPADLMVIQHCHSITATVVNMLKAYASSMWNPKRYMTIDGYDTVRILRHFGRRP